MKLFLATVILFFSSAPADTATQSDWSGGPGIWTVTAWENRFDAALWMIWSYPVGQIELSLQLPAHDVTDSLPYIEFAFSGDLDEDGDEDVIGVSSAYDYEYICLFENEDGTGTTWTARYVSGDTGDIRSTSMADIDGDADQDIIYATYNMVSYLEDIVWLENLDGSGESWVEHIVAETFGGATYASVGDVDGDGDMDIVGSASVVDDVRWWENLDGAGQEWAEHMIDPYCNGAIYVEAFDMDADGDTDALGGGLYAGDVVWWENAEGTGTAWEKHSCSDGQGFTRHVRTADIDIDGDRDYIVASLEPSELSWWENLDGLGTSWVEHPMPSGRIYANPICAGDFDSDGDPDIGSYGSGWIGYWQNPGNPFLDWNQVVICEGDCCYDSPWSIMSCDLDGDAALEILCAFRQLNGRITWWDIDAPPAYQETAWLESSILSIGYDPDWQGLSWSAITPPGTSLGFQLRAADDCVQMGEWSDVIWTPGSLDGILEDYSSFVQYRAILTTVDPDTTPTLLDVTLTWNSLGTGGGTAPTAFELLPVTPNPCTGCPVIEFGLPSAGLVGLYVFDISGRLVREIAASEYQPGWHTAQLGDLRPGIYFVQMRTGVFEATDRFVVIE